MIELHDISKSFSKKGERVNALTGVSLNVERGKIFGIIGSSGAGKSTLIRTVNLLERPDHGKVIVDGQDLLTLSPKQLNYARRHIGMIFQHFSLLSSRTVFDNIAFALELDKAPKAVIEERVSELLKLVGLEEKRNDYPKSLSGGQKQRVAIARALATNPKVLLCDEATSALDPATTTSILQLLQRINRQFKITILLITHEMDVVKSICHDVGIISEGQLIEQGPVSEIFSAPKTEVARRFIETSLETDIPEVYRSKLSDAPATDKNTLVKLMFNGKSSEAPVLSAVAREFDVDSNVVSSRLEYLGDQKFGVLLVELQGSAESRSKALAYFEENNILTQVVGYV